MEDRRCCGGGEGSLFRSLKFSPLDTFASCIDKEMLRLSRLWSIRFELYKELLQLGSQIKTTRTMFCLSGSPVTTWLEHSYVIVM